MLMIAPAGRKDQQIAAARDPGEILVAELAGQVQPFERRERPGIQPVKGVLLPAAVIHLEQVAAIRRPGQLTAITHGMQCAVGQIHHRGRAPGPPEGDGKPPAIRRKRRRFQPGILRHSQIPAARQQELLPAACQIETQHLPALTLKKHAVAIRRPGRGIAVPGQKPLSPALQVQEIHIPGQMVPLGVPPRFGAGKKHPPPVRSYARESSGMATIGQAAQAAQCGGRFREMCRIQSALSF